MFDDEASVERSRAAFFPQHGASQRWPSVAIEHDAANQLHWQAALADELVVELLEGEVGAFGFAVVVAELEDLEFAEGVIEVGRVVGAAAGFLEGDFRLDVALLHEELLSLFHSPAGGVQLDSDDVTAIAQQGLAELSEPYAWVAVAVALVDDHLLGVVRPAFDVGAAG